MNRLLLNHKPDDISEDKFIEMWNNSGYLLRILAAAIKDLTPSDRIRMEDFEMPNHYAQMVWAQAQRDFAKKVLDLMPESVDR